MTKDDPLRNALVALATASNGRISFKVRTSPDLGAELGVDLSHSTNPVYDFTVSPPGEAAFRCIAYTLTVDASKRPASRVEALGSSLAVENGKLFELNPFLLVFDYTGQQFMAVAATALFGAFAREAASRTVPKSESASFSLTPNFKNGTVKMYADVPATSIARAELATLTPDSVVAVLTKVRDETAAQKSQIPDILKAIVARLGEDVTAATASAAATGPAALGVVATVPVPDSSEPAIRIDDRVRRMVRTAIRSAPAVILVGPPGTGKTALLREACREAAQDPGAFGLATFEPPLWATPDESWTVRDLVGGDTIVGDAIQFRAGRVLAAIAENRWLVFDEVNRADMDRIFGGLLTWLSGGEVTLGATSTAPGAAHVELAWNVGQGACVTEGIDAQGGYTAGASKVRYSAGDGWRLLGTYNALDAQRVFRFGAALGRRFVRVPIPAPDPAMFAEVLAERAADLPLAMRSGIAGLYDAHHASEATQLGPAIFLAMCNYIRVASPAQAPVDGAAADAEASPTSATQAANALTEAYVVHAGTWLAHLDRRDLAELGERVRGPVMTPGEWSWVTQMIRSLA